MDDGSTKTLTGRDRSQPRAPVPSLGAPLFRTQLECLRQMVGDDGYERALARLPAETAERIRLAPALGWVPLELVEAVVTAAAEEVGEDLEDFHLTLIQKSTAATLRGIWRLFARLTSREALLKRAGTYWRKTWSHGHYEYTSEEDGTMDVRVTGLVQPSVYMLRGVAYSIRSLLEHTGKKVTEVHWVRTREGADYQIRWD